jgi:hypothetical protein
MGAPTRESSNPYDLRAACARCPFRTDVEPYLRADRAASIAAGLRQGAQFSCHKTTRVEEVENDEGELVEEMTDGPNAKFCAGALATIENEGQPNQLMRIAESLGMYDAKAMLRRRLPVHDSLSAWVRAHREHEQGGPDAFMVTDPWPLPGYEPDRIPMTHCEVVADDCEDPAGFADGGGVHESDDEPTCNPFTDECQGCNKSACTACRSDVWSTEQRGERLCVECAERDERDDDEDQDDDEDDDELTRG